VGNLASITNGVQVRTDGDESGAVSACFRGMQAAMLRVKTAWATALIRDLADGTLAWPAD
jgi:hypothetical protein